MSGRLFFSAVSEASVEGEGCSGIAEVGEALQRWDTDPCLHTPSILSRQFERKESEKRALSQSDNMREKIVIRYTQASRPCCGLGPATTELSAARPESIGEVQEGKCAVVRESRIWAQWHCRGDSRLV
jgi:hypothetical protein